MKKKLETFTCTRRSLLEAIGLGAAGAFVLSACQNAGVTLPPATTTSCGTSTCINLVDPANADLAKVGGAMLVDIGSDTVIVARMSENTVAALSAVCTHQGELVDYNATANRVECPAHGSQFGMDGKVERGPAARPLKVYTATITDNTITVS